jgi:hypothetical protein
VILNAIDQDAWIDDEDLFEIEQEKERYYE